MLREMKKHRSSDLVITGKNGPLAVRSYQRSFELLQNRLGIPRRGFHALRHTFATRAIECGMDIKSLSEILGHKNPTITLNRYVHSLMEHKKSMMDKLGRLL
jgi:integrase